MKLVFLKSNNDFIKIIKRKYKQHLPFGTTYFLWNNLKTNQYGISISKKVSKNAVVRNKIKRQLKAIIYQFEKNNECNCKKSDYVIVVSSNYLKYTFQQIEEMTTNFLKKRNEFSCGVTK